VNEREIVECAVTLGHQNARHTTAPMITQGHREVEATGCDAGDDSHDG
jgi:hypothetical protein